MIRKLILPVAVAAVLGLAGFMGIRRRR